VLSALGLVGAGADVEVRLGGSQVVDGRFLAALRVMCARDVAEVRGVKLQDLQRLDTPVRASYQGLLVHNYIGSTDCTAPSSSYYSAHELTKSADPSINQSLRIVHYQTWFRGLQEV
jgi:hypothetical protein